MQPFTLWHGTTLKILFIDIFLKEMLYSLNLRIWCPYIKNIRTKLHSISLVGLIVVIKKFMALLLAIKRDSNSPRNDTI
jgi:hypothetical protein